MYRADVEVQETADGLLVVEDRTPYVHRRVRIGFFSSRKIHVPTLLLGPIDSAA